MYYFGRIRGASKALNLCIVLYCANISENKITRVLDFVFV